MDAELEEIVILEEEAEPGQGSTETLFNTAIFPVFTQPILGRPSHGVRNIK